MQSIKRLIPPALVQLKHELVLELRCQADPRFRALVSSPEAGGLITYFASGGLANRLRAHHLTSLLGAQWGRKVVPVWLRTKELASDGSDIFPKVTHASSGDRRLSYHKISIKTLNERGLASDTTKDRLVVLDVKAQWVEIDRARTMVGSAAPVSFQFTDGVLRATNAIEQELGRPAVAVHMRQTDFRGTSPYLSVPWAKPAAYFEDKILEVLAAAGAKTFHTLLVASDEHPKLQSNVTARFAKVVVLTPKFGRADNGVAPEALSHLLALARADEFIGSPNSSFSEFVEALRRGTVTL